MMPDRTDVAVPSRLLFDARSPDSRSGNSGSSSLENGEWRIINDTVMGGQSTSQFEHHSDHARFSGTVSLDGGGFASVRFPVDDHDVTEATSFVLLIKGDGSTINFTAYTEAGGRVSYRSAFTAPHGWTRIKIPFADLSPYRRGQRIESAPAFDPSGVHEIGFLIADRQEGPFHIDIGWIGAE